MARTISNNGKGDDDRKKRWPDSIREEAESGEASLCEVSNWIQMQLTVTASKKKKMGGLVEGLKRKETPSFSSSLYFLTLLQQEEEARNFLYYKMEDLQTCIVEFLLP